MEPRTAVPSAGLSRGTGSESASTPAATRRTVPGQRRRSEPRPVPVVQEAFAHLSIEALRDYRRALNDEEGKVSYWRRLLQGRLDVVTQRSDAPGRAPGHPAHDRLGSMLTSERVGAGRSALSAVVPSDDIPPLPLLAELWQRQYDPSDTAAHERLADDLRAAEAQLSAYRTALHSRLAEATGELIARYRVDPTLCLSALPLPRASGA